MIDWVAATLDGIVLGLAFYGCVRLRMTLGPIIRERYGNWARRIYWLLTIALMVLLANIALLVLRASYADPSLEMQHMLQELWFISLAVGIAFGLIFLRVTRKKK